MKKLIRLFTKQTLWGINILAAICLVCTKLIPFINPAKLWIMGILGLATPVIAILNVIIIIIWMLFGKWRRMLLSTVAIVLTWNVFSVGIGGNIFNKTPMPNPSEKVFTVMSYNVRLMDYYHSSGMASTRKDLLQFIKSSNVSVLCLQEFFSSEDSIGIQNVKEICNSCGYNYFSANKNFVSKRGFFGDIIFSKFPIVNTKSIPFDTTTLTHRFQYADIVWQQDTIRLFNLHLQSVRFDKSEIAMLDNVSEKSKPTKIGNQNASKTQLEKSKIIIKKLKTSSGKRGLQADIVADEINKSPYANMVCGDFNDIPSSYTYFTIRGKLNDAFLDKGFGLGRTYNDISPTLRIDNIFYDAKKFSAIAYQNKNVNYSDHHPISLALVKND
jgi:endonuclease/exonuclease/phosphatase family metal-dependent hydrolase